MRRRRGRRGDAAGRPPRAAVPGDAAGRPPRAAVPGDAAALAPAAEPARASRAVLVLLGLLLLTALVGRVTRLDRPRDLFFDEVYYVNAARVILDTPRPAENPWAWHPAGIDPNVEHPPGGKLLLAASIRLLGDNPWGWRLPGALLGTAAILLLFLLARRAGAAPGVALLAAFAFACDDLAFVHGRVATLDGPQLAFMLAGLWAYLADRPVLAGVALVASALVKITGFYGLGALIVLEGLRWWRARRTPGVARRVALRRLALVVTVFVVGYPLALGALDLGWGVFKNPFEHLRYVFSYGYTLTTTGGSAAATSFPWQWLLNLAPMLYHQDAGLTVRAAMNPAVVFATVPAVVWAAFALRRPSDEVPLVVLALFAACYLPYLPAAAAGRVSYIYYFLPALPAVALGAASLASATRVRVVPWLYAAAVVAGFAWRFPYRGGF